MDNPVDGHGKVLVGKALGPENEGSADGQLVGVCPRGEGQILIKKRVLGMLSMLDECRMVSRLS